MAKPQRWDMKRKLVELKRFERTIPKEIANIVENQTLENFDNESFSDGSINSDPWVRRKYSTKQDRRTGKRRGLLVQSGSLVGSIRVGSATMKKIAVGSYGIKYAKYHNNGTAKIPKRQFIGESRIQTAKIRKLINKRLKQII